MKKGDLTKRYKDVRTGCKLELSIKLILFSLLPLINLTAQVNLAGFGQAEIIRTRPGNTKIYACDYSGDGLDDFILYGDNQKHVVIYPSEKGIFSQIPATKFFYYPITDIKKFNKTDLRGQEHLFISRSGRRVGIFTFTKWGTMYLYNSLRLDSFPDGLAVGNINEDPQLEALIYGSNFDGLMILSENGWELSANQIISNTAYSFADFQDLNYDGFTDIAALSLIDNAVHLFYGDLTGHFEMAREIPLNVNVAQFKLCDFNKDRFSDFIISNNEGFNIFWGDSVSSYGRQTRIETSQPPDNFLAADVNDDNINDLVSVSNTTGILAVNFFIPGYEESREVIFHRFKGSSDLILSKDKQEKRIAAVDDTGIFFSLKYFSKPEGSFSLSMGAEPICCQLIDLSGNGSKDIILLDKYDERLKFILNEPGSLLNFYSEINLPKKFNSLRVFNNPADQMAFLFLFNRNEQILEILRVDKNNDVLKYPPLYMPGDIIDLLPSGGGIDENPDVYLLLKEKSHSAVYKYSNEENRWTGGAIGKFSEDLKHARFFGKEKAIFWQTDSASVLLKISDLSDSLFSTKEVFYHKLKKRGNFSLFFNEHNSANMSAPAAFLLENRTLFMIKQEEKDSSFNVYSIRLSLMGISNNVTVFDYKTSKNNCLFIEDISNKRMNILVREDKSENYLPLKVIESVAGNGYFATKLFSNKDYLVYIDTLTNSIKFTELDEEK